MEARIAADYMEFVWAAPAGSGHAERWFGGGLRAPEVRMMAVAGQLPQTSVLPSIPSTKRTVDKQSRRNW